MAMALLLIAVSFMLAILSFELWRMLTRKEG